LKCEIYLQNPLPSPTNSPYLCRQRNAARQAGDVEAGSLLEAASNGNQGATGGATAGAPAVAIGATSTPKSDLV